MGSPKLGVIAEVFLQCYEHVFFKHLLETKTILSYIQYVDDI